MTVYGNGLLTLDHLLAVDLFPRRDEKRDLKNLVQQPGGPVPNALAFCGRSGLDIELAAEIGDDCPGMLIHDFWQMQGFSSRFIKRCSDIETPQAFVLIEEKYGQRTVFLHYPNKALTKISPEFISQPGKDDFFLTDGRFPEIQLELTKAAYSQGACTLLDPGNRKMELLPWQSCISHLIVSKTFILKNFGEIDLFTALHKLRHGSVKSAAITLGAGGAIVLIGENPEFIPPKKVRAVDTNAAGDIFHGAFIYGLSAGQALLDAYYFANSAAAFSTQFTGTHHAELNANAIFQMQ
jgi:sulfofructose kinase